MEAPVMLRNIAFIVSLIFFIHNQSSYAETNPEKKSQHCSQSILHLVGEHFGLNDFSYPKEGMYASTENGGVITAGVCQEWPKDISKTISIFAYDDTDTQENDEKQLIVALVDNIQGTVIATYKGVIQQDAAMTVGENSFWIDTARYDVAPGVRAFGLDVTTSYSQGCVDGGLGPVLTLFIQEGKEIKPILENFYRSTWSFVTGGPSCATQEEIITENITYFIGISKTTTNGYADLLINAVSSLSNGVKSKRKPFQYKLRYDGEKYPTSLFNGAGVELDRWQSAP